MGDVPRFLFVANPKAGKHTSDLEQMIANSIGDNADWDLRTTQRAGHASELVESSIPAGYDVIVAVGGDGTLHEVGGALAGSGIPMGIVPAGSGNALARALGVSLDCRFACTQLLSGVIRSIDVGHLGEEIFLSTAGIGLDAEVCWRFNNEPGGRGLLPYISHSLRGVLDYEARPVCVYLDDSETGIDVWPTLLTLANTPAFGYGATIAPGALPDDGLLDISIVEGMTALRAVLHARRLFNGTFDRTPGVTTHRVERLRIEREGPGHIQVDGESRDAGPSLEAWVTPGGLRVVVPA